MNNKRPHPTFSTLQRQLLNGFQRDFPLCADPYAEIGRRLGVAEETVIAELQRLSQQGVVSRVGPVLRPHALGSSTLAAMVVPEQQLEKVARQVSSLSQVNHNYAREHHFNLWFVVTADDEQQLADTLADIEALTGLEVMSLPLEEAYYIDLGFDLSKESAVAANAVGYP